MFPSAVWQVIIWLNIKITNHLVMKLHTIFTKEKNPCKMLNNSIIFRVLHTVNSSRIQDNIIISAFFSARPVSSSCSSHLYKTRGFPKVVGFSESRSEEGGPL